MARACVFDISGISRLFRRFFRQVSSPSYWVSPLRRVDCILGELCIFSSYLYFWCVIVFCILCISIFKFTYIIPVMNAYTRVVYFLYVCHTFDVVYYCLIICVYSTLTLLQVLYPAFRLHSSSGISIPNLGLRLTFGLLCSAW